MATLQCVVIRTFGRVRSLPFVQGACGASQPDYHATNSRSSPSQARMRVAQRPDRRRIGQPRKCVRRLSATTGRSASSSKAVITCNDRPRTAGRANQARPLGLPRRRSGRGPRRDATAARVHHLARLLREGGGGQRTGPNPTLRHGGHWEHGVQKSCSVSSVPSVDSYTRPYAAGAGFIADAILLLFLAMN